MKQPAYLIVPCPTCGHPTRMLNGATLKALRETAGLTQREFGATCGLSSPYVSDIERNRRACPRDVLAAYQVLHKRKGVKRVSP